MSSGGRRNVVVVVLAALFAAQLGYVLWRGAVVTIDFYDAYSYLSNARRLAGDASAGYQTVRPPLLPILQMPAVAIAAAGEPANVLYRVGPHLTSALLSIASALAVWALLRWRFGPVLGLAGAVLFAGQRLYVHYAAHVLTDVLATGCLAAAVWLYLRAREKYSLRAYVLAGVAAAAAVLARHNLVLVPLLLGVAEAGLMAAERRFLDRRALGLAVIWLVSQALVVVVYLIIAEIVTGTVSLATVAGWLEAGLRSVGEGMPGESRTDYFAMAPGVFSWPLCVLAAAGLVLAAVRPDRRDIPFVVWLVVIGGPLFAAAEHNEARYLFPLLPPWIHFALRAIEPVVEWARARWPRLPLPGRAGIAAAVMAAGASMLQPGVEQVVFDADPIFTSDVQRRAAARMLELHEPPGRFGWIGGTHNLMPRHAQPIPLDEIFSIYHFDHLALDYFSHGRIAITARPADPGANVEATLAATGRPGDVYLRAHPRLLWTHELARHRPRSSSIEIFSVRAAPGGNVVRREVLP